MLALLAGVTFSTSARSQQYYHDAYNNYAYFNGVYYVATPNGWMAFGTCYFNCGPQGYPPINPTPPRGSYQLPYAYPAPVQRGGTPYYAPRPSAPVQYSQPTVTPPPQYGQVSKQPLNSNYDPCGGYYKPTPYASAPKPPAAGTTNCKVTPGK